MKRWLVLDLDDTLFLEQDFVRSGFESIEKYVSGNWNVNGFGIRCWEQFEKGFRNNIFNLVASEFSIEMSNSSLAELVKVYREHEPSIKVDSDVLDSLTELSETFSLALLTGGATAVQESKVRALKIGSFFEHIVYAGAWGDEFDKPNIKGWSRVEELVAKSGKELTYVGDNPEKDWPACKQLKWNFVRIRQPGSLHFSEATPEEIVEVSRFSELISLLRTDH